MSQLFKISTLRLQCGSRLLLSNLRNAVTFQFQPKTVDDPKLTHDELNMNLKRPLSPHLLIYKPQLTSILSITHRFTGLALASYAIGLSMTAVVCNKPFVTYIDAIELGSPSLTAIKFLIAFPFSFHFFNGVRHLCWDMGKFLSIKSVYLTGYVMLAASSATALYLTFM